MNEGGVFTEHGAEYILHGSIHGVLKYVFADRIDGGHDKDRGSRWLSVSIGAFLVGFMGFLGNLLNYRRNPNSYNPAISIARARTGMRREAKIFLR